MAEKTVSHMLLMVKQFSSEGVKNVSLHALHLSYVISLTVCRSGDLSCRLNEI